MSEVRYGDLSITDKEHIADALMAAKDGHRSKLGYYEAIGDPENAAYHEGEILLIDAIAARLELDPEYYKAETRKAPCDSCQDRGFILTSIDSSGTLEIQKCDACGIFEDDNDVLEVVYDLAVSALSRATVEKQMEAEPIAHEYIVHAFVPVRVTIREVMAATKQEAVRKAMSTVPLHEVIHKQRCFRFPDGVVTSVEWSEGDPDLYFLVDEADDPKHERSQWYAGDGKTKLDSAP